MTYNAYASINSLDEIPLIAGNQMTLTFPCYQEDGVTPLTITGYTAKVAISKFGQPETTILTKTGTVGTTSFTITLLNTDTASLFGKYIYQPILTSGAIEYRPSQGCFLIQSQIVAS